MKKIKLNRNQKLKTLQRGTFVLASVSIATICSYMFVVFNSTSGEESNASDKIELLTTDPINNGEIICGYSWDNNLTKAADVGPSAESISRNAECTEGGRNSTYGLSAGNTGRNINMMIAAEESFNAGGLDISVDFRRYEESANFFTRGNYFNFGMKDGKIVIKYKIKNENGKIISIDEITRYDIPSDTSFRNFRFIYNPVESKGEIFVENVAVWSNEADAGARLWWNETDPITIGEEMNGGSKSIAILDNLIIRATGRARTMPLKLLSFSAEMRGDQVMLNWFTGVEEGTEYFKIERSVDTHSYEEIGRVKAAGNSNELRAYALLDTKPVTGVSYYRLSMPNTDVKSVWVPVIAFRSKQQGNPAVTSTSLLNSN
jgi:hypothetical protein